VRYGRLETWDERSNECHLTSISLLESRITKCNMTSIDDLAARVQMIVTNNATSILNLRTVMVGSFGKPFRTDQFRQCSLRLTN
jgi:hypothetical protein